MIILCGRSRRSSKGVRRSLFSVSPRQHNCGFGTNHFRSIKLGEKSQGKKPPKGTKNENKTTKKMPKHAKTTRNH